MLLYKTHPLLHLVMTGRRILSRLKAHPGHLDIKETTRNGKATFRLLADDEMMCEFFDEWAYQLAISKKFRTVKAYCYAVSRFLNYIYEVIAQQGFLTPILLRDALDSYESYLAYGADSEAPLAASTAKALGTGGIGASSIDLHFVAINNFIDASERLRIGLQQLEQAGYLSDSSFSVLPLSMERYQKAPLKIKQAIKSKSWLAGCIAGGLKSIKVKGLVAKAKNSVIAYTDCNGGDDLVFPIDKCKALIDSAKCLRDKVLWSFIAASGCRISEALTLLVDDINPSEGKVRIVDPNTRKDILAKYMSTSEIEKLDHKGRITEETFLIEPFASMFWINLDLYIQEEREKESLRLRPKRHRFLFRNLKNGDAMPSSYQATWERFNKATKELGLNSYGFHSLRHMYGYYLVNFCPNPSSPNKFGLDLKMVQKFMGHKTIEATQRYARKDAKLLEFTLSSINMLRLRDDSFSVANSQIKYLENQLGNMKKSIGLEVGYD